MKKEQIPVITLEGTLKDFNVKSSGPVARYLMQGDIEDPEWLYQGLSDMNVDICIKRPFLKYWLNIKGKPVPAFLNHRLNNEADKLGPRPSESSDNKYSVDPATGVIRVAQSTDKVALNWAEAERLAQYMKEKAVSPPKEVTFEEIAEFGRWLRDQQENVKADLPPKRAPRRIIIEVPAGTEVVIRSL